ncbi:MAG: phosphotransferase [Steroidobacteraceae bacterium]
MPDKCANVHLLQGDTGPYQFTFDGDQLTGLIDWELARFGDPMVDIGCMRMRAVLYSMPNIAEHIAYYKEVIRGRNAFDVDAIRFHTTSWLLSTACVAMAHRYRSDPKLPDMIAYFAWGALVRRALCESLWRSRGASSFPCDSGRTCSIAHLPESVAARAFARAASATCRGSHRSTSTPRPALAGVLAAAEKLGPAFDAVDVEHG